MADYVGSMRSKTGMKTLFGKKNIKKDNTEGKVQLMTITCVPTHAVTLLFQLHTCEDYHTQSPPRGVRTHEKTSVKRVADIVLGSVICLRGIWLKTSSKRPACKLYNICTHLLGQLYQECFEHVVLVQLTVLPAVEELQTDEATRARWIDYSAYDAKATWQLCQALRKELKVCSNQPLQCTLDSSALTPTTGVEDLGCHLRRLLL